MPFEVTKTRQQMLLRQGSAKSNHSVDVISSMRDAIKERGIGRGLFAGVSLQIVQSSGKVGINI